METNEPQTEPVRKRFIWMLSLTLGFIFALILAWQWTVGSRTEIDATQLVDQSAVDVFLLENWQTRSDEDAVTLPTGVFVQSVRLLDSSDIHLSAYIWQRRIDGIHDHLSEGFILPEQINSEVRPRLEYRVRQGDEEVVGWYVEGTFRQRFDFDDFPFDQKTVWIRIWPKDFSANVVLVPDFAAYPCPTQPELTCTGQDDVFGVEESIVLGAFTREDTYFDYQLSDYNSNFGIVGYVGQSQFPELRFNVVIKRRVISAFIINLVPLIVVACLAFAVLMATTRQQDEARRLGFSTLAVIASISALAFVILLAQVQMRSLFASSGFVYLETIYFLMYLMLLVVVINAYVVNSPRWSDVWMFRYGDNLIAKASYWPMLIGMMVLVTALSL